MLEKSVYGIKSFYGVDSANFESPRLAAALEFVGRAFVETCPLSKIIFYKTAAEIVVRSKNIQNEFGKMYRGISAARAQELTKRITDARDNIVHKGIATSLTSDEERLLQLLILDAAVSQLNETGKRRRAFASAVTNSSP